MISKKRIAVLMGGPSSEHEVSLHTGESMLRHLSSDLYDVVRVYISKEGAWTFGNEVPLPFESALNRLEEVDVALLALHGTFGEDGELQEHLEKRGIAFTGSGSHASRVAMSKNLSNQLYMHAGLFVPDWEHIYESDQSRLGSIIEAYGFPLVVKPDKEGSSVGVSIVKHKDELDTALTLAFKCGSAVVIQRFVAGREVSCGVIENASGKPMALPPTELIPDHSEFFDYEAKYTNGGALEITPPDMPDEQIGSIQRVALSAHQLLGCAGYSRTDIIIADDAPYVLETNTLPGLTQTSILPQQAEKAGIAFETLLAWLIESARNR